LWGAGGGGSRIWQLPGGGSGPQLCLLGTGKKGACLRGVQRKANGETKRQLYTANVAEVPHAAQCTTGRGSAEKTNFRKNSRGGEGGGTILLQTGLTTDQAGNAVGKDFAGLIRHFYPNENPFPGDTFYLSAMGKHRTRAGASIKFKSAGGGGVGGGGWQISPFGWGKGRGGGPSLRRENRWTFVLRLLSGANGTGGRGDYSFPKPHQGRARGQQ